MTHKPCQRLWQVEAARDGRLVGSDLSNALRHRAECVDCNQAARALGELGRSIKGLPQKPMDPLRQRRARQALLGAWNDHLLAERRPNSRRSVALLVALCAIAGVALAIGLPLVRGASHSSRPAVGHLKIQPRVEPKAAAPARAEPSPEAIPVLRASAEEPALVTAPPRSTPTKSRSARPAYQRPAEHPAIDTAEDDAYLQIVGLLRSGHEREARAMAAQYLLQFPTGFRRREVENIARR